MLRPSFVPPPPIRRLRDLTRYRADLVAVRTAEKQRVEKLLEDAQIKLSVVASDIFGVSGREMLAALIAGERDPKVLAQLARARMRAKTGAAGGGVHRPLHRPPRRSCWPDAGPDRPGQRRHHRRARRQDRRADRPFRPAVDRLDEIPGVGRTAAQVIIAEIGLDMGRFPTPAHLASWARFAPGVKESAGKTKGAGSTGHGNPYLARVLGEAAVAAGKTDTFLGERYRRIARRRGGKQGHRRGRPLHPGHRLAPAGRPRRPLPRPRRRLLRHPHRPRTRQAQPHPPARSPRLQGHPRTRRLSRHHRPAWTRLRCAAPGAAACPLTVDFRISSMSPLGGAVPA